MAKKDIEVEVRFLEINVAETLKKLEQLGAEDLGEESFKEIIFSDKAHTWFPIKKRLRLRQTKNKTFLTYKFTRSDTLSGTQELEVEVSNFEQTKKILEEIGLDPMRFQEKKRHSFRLGKAIVDIDTWPSIPTYLEIEAPSEKIVKNTTKLLELDWKKAVFKDAATLINEFYKIPVLNLKYFTFSKIE